MSRKIHIEKLVIRVKNASPAKARGIAGNLGGEILRQIAERTRHTASGRRIESLDAGQIVSGQNAGSAEIQKQIARQIAELIGERIGEGAGK